MNHKRKRRLRTALIRWLAGPGLLGLLPACAPLAGFPDESRCPVLERAPASLSTLPSAPPPPLHGLRTRNVVLVTIDGVRWQEIFGGVDPVYARAAGLLRCGPIDAAQLLPNLYRHFVGGGVALGAPAHGEVVASGPNFVSLPGYQEILAGRASSCRSNSCATVTEPTLLDELHTEAELGPEQIAVISSWETIERAAARDPSAIVLSTGRGGGKTRERVRVTQAASHLLDEGARAEAYPGGFDYRPDRYTAALALAYLASVRPRFLFVGLGDTDEFAHRRNYAGYLSALGATDRFLGQLMETLATLGEYGRETTVLVTTDHGRAADFAHHGGDAPESGRVWLVASGGAVPRAGLVDAAVPVRLSDIAPTVRRWMGLPQDRSRGAGNPLAALLSPPSERGPTHLAQYTTHSSR